MMQPGKNYITKDRGVRVKHAFGLWSVGDVFFPASGCERDMLLMNGCVEEVPEEPATEEPSAQKRKAKGT